MGSRRLALIGVLLATLAPGCAAPRAYEREALSSARMRLDDEGGEAFLVRGVTQAREEGHVGAGASAGSAGGGGGCGCN